MHQFLMGIWPIGAIVHDSNGDVVFAMEDHFLLSSSIDLAEAIAMDESMINALEDSITPP